MEPSSTKYVKRFISIIFCYNEVFSFLVNINHSLLSISHNNGAQPNQFILIRILIIKS